MFLEGVTMRQIAFFSQKGGCGKTTSCVNIAAALALLGRRVLVVDLDSNACASRTFGALENLENSIAAALLGLRPLAAVTQLTEVEKIWLVPGATDLHTLGDVEGIVDPKSACSSPGAILGTTRPARKFQPDSGASSACPLVLVSLTRAARATRKM
jgi:hypothetical protein